MLRYWLRAYGYEVLAGVFLILSILTFLNVAAAWHAAQAVLWRALAYGALDAAMSYAFWRRARWLLPFFALNAAGSSILLFLRQDLLGGAIPVLMNIGIFVFLHTTKSVAQEEHKALGAASFALWAGLFGYSLFA